MSIAGFVSQTSMYLQDTMLIWVGPLGVILCIIGIAVAICLKKLKVIGYTLAVNLLVLMTLNNNSTTNYTPVGRVDMLMNNIIEAPLFVQVFICVITVVALIDVYRRLLEVAAKRHIKE